MLSADDPVVQEHLGKLHAACVDLVSKQRAEMLLPLFAASDLRQLFSEKDGKVSTFLKVVPGTTKVYDLNGRFLSYSQVQNKKLRCRCTVMVRSVFSNGNAASIQLQLHKVIVESIEDRLPGFGSFDPAKLIRCG
jgi:hypothetical protein